MKRARPHASPSRKARPAGAPACDATVRGKLLDAAADLFDRKGYAATTVREIVAVAGVSKPALYYYYGSKEGIYLALMGTAFAQAEQTLVEARESAGSAVGRIFHLCARNYDLFRRNLKVARVMYAIYYGPPQGAPAFDFDAYHLRFQGQLRALLEEGMQAGEVRRMRVEDAMWAVIGALNIAMEVELCHPELSPGPAGLERLLRAVFNGVAVPAARPEKKGVRR